MYACLSPLSNLFNVGRRTVSFSGETQKAPSEDVGRNSEGPDRDRAIKFEKVCLLTNYKTLLI